MDEILDHLPPKLADFVFTQGSLTARLEAHSKKPLKVEIIYQGYQPLTFAQKSQLGLPPNRPQMAWVRSVKLYGDTDAWVLAKSIFPLSSLTGSLARLKALGATPIGYVLFKKGNNCHLSVIFIGMMVKLVGKRFMILMGVKS